MDEKEFIAKVTDVSDVPFAMACLNEEGKIVEYGPYQITFAHEIDHIPLYTKDQLQHEWVGLTDEERVQAFADAGLELAYMNYDADMKISKVIEAKLREKNT